jgi:putative peptidoglycan lipid II flippase
MEGERVLSSRARQVTRAAALISAGNVASRVLGLVREMVKSYYFGAGGAVSAFDVASQVPTMLYDLLAGGMLSSALVPVFSDYARPERREELWRLMNVLLSLLALFLGAVVVLIEVGAPLVARLLSEGLDPQYLQLATQMIRITTPAILFLSVSALFSGVLYALQRFERPAFITAVSNLTLILVVVALGRSRLGPHSLAIGLLAGSLAQVLLQWPALRDARLRFVSPFTGHPALGTIAALYLPIGLGLVVDQAAVGLSFNLASRTGPSGIAWMKLAATLIQFPLGMVVTAVSVAILPTLSRYAADDEDEQFRATLAQGLRLVLILALPAAVGMFALAEPLVALLFQRGNFMPSDTAAVAQALRFNLLGLIFAALDQALIFAFYARKDTWTPALVGVGMNLVYSLMVLVPTLFHEPLLWQIILANSLKLTGHALVMLYLFSRRVGTLRPYGVIKSSSSALVASLIMVVPVLATRALLSPLRVSGLPGVLTQVGASAVVGALVYLFVLRQLRLEELDLLRRTLLSRLKKLLG